MPTTIFAQRLPLLEQQKKEVQKLFGSQGYLKLREMIQAKCIEAQVDAMDLLLYPENEVASEKAKARHQEAMLLNQMLDTLDGLQGKEDEWFTVKLEHK